MKEVVRGVPLDLKKRGEEREIAQCHEGGEGRAYEGEGRKQWKGGAYICMHVSGGGGVDKEECIRDGRKEKERPEKRRSTQDLERRREGVILYLDSGPSMR